MLKREKGFTLIELLAVIVILAIIMVIATPIVIKTIDDAKRGAFKNSAYGIIKAAEFEYSRKIIDNGATDGVTFTFSSNGATSDPTGYTLDYKGERPTSGTLTINAQGEVAIAIHNGTFCAEKPTTTDIVTVNDKTVENCVLGETP